MKKIKTEEFDKYVANYDMSDAAIDRKYHHTYRVMENCLKIAECLNLDDDKKYFVLYTSDEYKNTDDYEVVFQNKAGVILRKTNFD